MSLTMKYSLGNNNKPQKEITIVTLLACKSIVKALRYCSITNINVSQRFWGRQNISLSTAYPSLYLDGWRSRISPLLNSSTKKSNHYIMHSLFIFLNYNHLHEDLQIIFELRHYPLNAYYEWCFLFSM